MKKDKECKKNKESTIGKIIYGFLLFMPLLAIVVTCAYAIFNKNAYQSTAMTEDTKYELIGNQEELENDKYYQFYTNSKLIIDNPNQIIKFKNFTSIGGFTTTEITQIEKTNSFKYYQNENGRFIHFSLNNASNHYYINFANNENVLTRNLIFNFQYDDADHINIYLNNIYILQFGQSNLLDNVFFYSINKVEQSNLFNWVENSVIYTGMSNFTTALSINNTFIPLLLTYWLIISVVYFLYDIVLMILHVLHRKIHELQDSL